MIKPTNAQLVAAVRLDDFFKVLYINQYSSSIAHPGHASQTPFSQLLSLLKLQILCLSCDALSQNALPSVLVLRRRRSMQRIRALHRYLDRFYHRGTYFHANGHIQCSRQ